MATDDPVPKRDSTHTKEGILKELETEHEKEYTCDIERQFRRENTFKNFVGLVMITSSYLVIVVIMGFFFGGVSTLFHEAIHIVEVFWKETVWEEIEHSMPSWWFPYVHMGLSTTVTGLGIGLIVANYIPECEGGGTAAVKICLQYSGVGLPVHTGVSRFVLTALYIGGGNVLGSEAPTLHICSVVAANFYDIIHRIVGEGYFSAKNHKPMVMVGCSCGLSAAFNTPMGGILYALEEFAGEKEDTSSRILSIWIALGSGAALATHRYIKGNHQFFEVDTVYPSPDDVDPWMFSAFLIAIVCAFLAHLFASFVLRLRKFRYDYVKSSLAMGIGSFIVSVILALWYLLSKALDYESFTWGVSPKELSKMIEHKDGWRAVFYFIAKFFAVAIAAAFGGSGGLFTPCLLMGGSIGVAISALFDQGVGDSESSATVCAIMGMTAFFSALLRLPLTSAIVSYEMTSHLSTGSSIFLPIVLTSLVSYYIADVLSPYDLAQRMMLQDGIDEVVVNNLNDDGPGERIRRSSIISWRSSSMITLPTHSSVSSSRSGDIPTFLTPGRTGRSTRAAPERRNSPGNSPLNLSNAVRVVPVEEID